MIRQKSALFHKTAADIPRLKAFEKAAAQGVTVNSVDDPRAKRAWEAYQAVGEECLAHG